MKRLLTAALALSLMGGAAAVAQDRHDDHRGDNRGPDRHDNNGGGHHWNKGQRLDTRYGQYQEVGDWRAHHLAAPRRGSHWVRSGDDYVLAAVTTGLIASAIAASR